MAPARARRRAGGRARRGGDGPGGRPAQRGRRPGAGPAQGPRAHGDQHPALVSRRHRSSTSSGSTRRSPSAASPPPTTGRARWAPMPSARSSSSAIDARMAPPSRRSRTPASSASAGPGTLMRTRRRSSRRSQRAVDDGSGIDEVRQLLADQGPRQPRDLLRPAARPGRRWRSTRWSRHPTIVRRFVSSAMSLGALSPEAHQAISIGMARLGCQRELGRGRRGPRLVRRVGGRRSARRGDQAGRLGALRGHGRVPGAGRPARDQDRPGIEAR